MNNTEPEKYYQKAALAVKITRYIATFLFIVFVLSCIFIFRSDITVENIQYLMKYADFYDNTEVPDSAEISVNADSESHVFMLRDNLAVVSRSGIGLYEFSGKKLFNYSLAYSDPGVSSDGRDILVYDITGNEISIFNSFSRVYSQKYPYSVKAGCINDSGFAIVTNEKTYRSGVIVYNSNYEEVYRWMLSDRYVTAIDLSSDGTKLLSASVKSHDGSYDTLITIRDIKKDEILYSAEIMDELALKIGFSDDASAVYLITDSMLRFYDGKLEEKSFYKYNQTKTEKFFVQNQTIILTENKNLSGNSMTLYGFDFNGNALFTVDADSKITSVCRGKDVMYALSSRYIYAYSFTQDGNVNFEAKFPSDSNFRNILCDSADRFVAVGTKKAHRGQLESLREQQNNPNT